MKMSLTGIATDQPTLTFESIGTDTFSYSPAGIEIHFKNQKMSLLGKWTRIFIQ
jgi:hypothetical protein